MKYQCNTEELIEHSPGNTRGRISCALVRPRHMNYCWRKEVQQALDKQSAHPNTCQTTPMLLHPVSWKNTPLGKLQAGL